jgi:hypothetical protein
LERGAYFGNDFGRHCFGRAFQRNVHRRGQHSYGIQLSGFVRGGL